MGNRSIWKGPFVEPTLLKRIQKIKTINKKNSTLKTWSRKSTILPNFININFLIHNGKKFIPIKIKEKMVGKKLGEFAPTRIFKKHTLKKHNNSMTKT